MNLATLVVHAHPAGLEALRARLLALPGVEIHGAHPCGRLVVSVEDEDENRLADTLLRVHGLEGVIAAALVYSQFESIPVQGERP